jgi:general stress protein 26
MTTAQSSSTEKFRELLDGAQLAMLTSVGSDGNLYSRPMALQNTRDFDGSLWFIADLDSDKAHQIEADQHVNVSFTKGSDRWVSVSGTARVVRDQQKLEELWNPFAKAWFPDGPRDPSVGLLRVTVGVVDYWETNSPKPIRLLQQMAAAATGRQPDLGESGSLKMS